MSYPSSLSLSWTKPWSLKRIIVTTLLIAGFAVFTSVCGHIRFYLPFTPVPITLQSFAVLLSGAVLGPWAGSLSQTLFLLAGGLGMKVFAGGMGAAALLGPTGGYLFGFALAAFISGKLFEIEKPRGLLVSSGLLFIASLYIFLPGTFWLSIATGMSMKQALVVGVLPFLPGDIVKVLLTALTINSGRYLLGRKIDAIRNRS